MLYWLADSHELPLYSVVNPDKIQIGLESKTGLALSSFGLQTSRTDFLRFVEKTTYSPSVKRAARTIKFIGGVMFSHSTSKTSYNAALVAAFLRDRLVAERMSFSFESVLSHPSKLDELIRAKKRGYRIYLYFVATDAIEISIGRVKERVASGGHDVPEKKIRKRYAGSLENVMPLLRLAYRAYIFDNSGREARLIAEKTLAGNLVLHEECIPSWCDEHVIAKL